MSEQRETYKLTSGRLSDESPYVKQQIAMQLKELAGSGQVLVGYREYSVMQGVPPEVLKTVEVLMGAGMDVIQAGACSLPELSLQSRVFRAPAVYTDDETTFYLDASGSYLQGEFPVVRVERWKRGGLKSIKPTREYVRFLRRELAAEALSTVSIAIGGLFNAELLSLLSQALPLKGLWRVRSERELDVQSVGDSVQRMQATLGIKLDSTGCLAEFVDEKGTKLQTAVAGALIARYLKEIGGLRSASKAWGISRFFDRVLDRCGLKIEENADLAVGEEIIYKPHLGVGDGLWLGLLLGEITAVMGRPLSEIIAEMEEVVGRTETRLLLLEKGELEDYLRKISGKKYSLEERGELQLAGTTIAWRKQGANLYQVLLDGEPSKLRSLSEVLPPGIS
ncbi:MAG: hypothetical protein ACOX29_05890 [Bacillota bacterium]|jgi:hypothetical protein|nr:hypothetical protein [Bacillota bacterium]NLU55173.1 hypothetical protein [Bacillota bacterium]HPQ10277.1 hypothetical protein [Bacillota bacterium]HPT60635.1 hypothetical protein [Bacillota bacterium]